MKTTNRFLIIVAIVSLSFISFSCKNKIKPIGHVVNGNKHTITLNVNTKIVTKRNLCKTSSFGQVDSISNEDYTVIVNPGDSITWKGFSTWSTDDIVNITKIKYKKGSHIFKKDDLTGNGRVKEKVKGKVLDSVKEGSEYEYKIFFTVIHNGKKRNGTFSIDPKIQIN